MIEFFHREREVRKWLMNKRLGKQKREEKSIETFCPKKKKNNTRKRNDMVE